MRENELSQFQLRKPVTTSEWACYHQIREKNIFMPIGLAYDRQHASLQDRMHHHYIFLKNEKIVGTLQLEVFASACAIRTIAIIGSYQRLGYGRVLLTLAEKECRRLGARVIHVHANPRAENFYVRNGYVKMVFPNDVSILANTIDYGKILRSDC